MQEFYSNEKNVQILVSLLKQNGIRKIIASPGTTNLTLVTSLQHDGFFEIYSSVDERSAAYIACGMAAESGEPVVLSCTGATASRNYFSGLTEAFYRKLPVLAVTSTQPFGRVGNYFPQVIDRSQEPKDILNCSVQIPIVQSDEDYWATRVQMNKAIIALKRNGGGPAHINMVTSYSNDFSVRELPKVQNIEYFEVTDRLPEITTKNVGVFVGSHVSWTDNLVHEVEAFCDKYNGVVLCDQTSNYPGRFRIDSSLISEQDYFHPEVENIELLIHIGQVSGIVAQVKPKEVWRVSNDGEVRDTFGKLSTVFNLSEEVFFSRYIVADGVTHLENSYYHQWKELDSSVRGQIKELPFSNIWVAQTASKQLPEESVVHFGILNSLRSWNLTNIPSSVRAYCNTGGFGIDGGVSSLVGASLCNYEKLYFGFFGDLGFFYDMNVLGNRHVGNNVRIIIINNGKGTEFTNYNHMGARLGGDANEFVAADGHFGHKSKQLIKDYVENLGFKYMAARNKDEFNNKLKEFLNPDPQPKPVVFEVFTDSENESKALKMINQTIVPKSGVLKDGMTSLIGRNRVDKLKQILHW